MADQPAGHLHLNGTAYEDAPVETPVPAQLHENLTQQVRAQAGGRTPTVEFEEIRLEEKVGHGSYGVVYRAVWRERPVAVKEFGASAEQKAIETEVKQLSRVSHPNIIALYGISTDQQSKYLIMEYAEGGSLHNFLHGKVQPAYSLAHAMNWARQCAEGVAYLHAMTPKPLIHRDLKPLNLLLTNLGRHLKICDFGTVADKSTMMTNNRGSAAWMAPEVFEGSKYTEKCDIFSWAIVLWEVLSRKQPFKDIDNTYSIMWKIHKGERPPLMQNCPQRIQTLMTSCWKTAPEERPSMKYVVSVMNEIAAGYPGADKPLEYLFINQQIITKDTCTTNEQYMALSTSASSSYSSNGSSTTSTQVTPTNVPTNTNTSGGSTPTNARSLGNGESTPGEGLFQPHASTTKAPQASIVSSNRWGAIPEEELLPESPSDAKVDSFKLTPSAEAAKRFDTILNVMMQAAAKPIQPLTLDVGANAFDLCDTENGINVAKSDGKERLTVTDGKILPPPPPLSGTAAAAAAATTTIIANMNDTNNNKNNNNNNSNNHDDNDAAVRDAGITDGEHDDTSLDDDDDDDDDSNMNDDENDDTDQSLTELLDPELQPQPPIANNAESQAIYREHRRLGKEYLRTVESLYYAQDFKEKLTLQMDLAERIQKQDLLLKIKEKEDLTTFYNNLKQQFEKMCADESTGTTDANNPNKNPAQQPHSVAAHGQLVKDGLSAQLVTVSAVNANATSADGSGGGGGGGGGGGKNNEMLSEDGWVVIAPN